MYSHPLSIVLLSITLPQAFFLFYIPKLWIFSFKIILSDSQYTVSKLLLKSIRFQGQNVIAVADKDIAEYLEELEATAEKKRNSPAVGPSASILHDKNIRVAHEEHTINQTLEHKRDLQHKDAARYG